MYFLRTEWQQNKRGGSVGDEKKICWLICDSCTAG